MPDTGRRVRVSPGTLSREVQGETVLLQLDRGEYFGLDDVGTRFWQLIVDTGDLDAARASALREFDADPAVLAADFEALVQELIAKQLLELVPHPATTPR